MGFRRREWTSRSGSRPHLVAHRSDRFTASHRARCPHSPRLTSRPDYPEDPLTGTLIRLFLTDDDCSPLRPTPHLPNRDGSTPQQAGRLLDILDVWFLTFRLTDPLQMNTPISRTFFVGVTSSTPFVCGCLKGILGR